MNPDDLKAYALSQLRIARDVTKPMAVRKKAANEIARIKVKLGAASKVPAKPAPVASTPVVDPNWVWRKTYQLEVAAVEGNQKRVAELRAEFVAKGLEIPQHRGYTPPLPDTPELPERPAAPLIDINERQMAIGARRTKPAGKRAIEWEQWRDTF